LLTFLLPIAIITLFALAFGGIGKKGQSRPVELLIADEDQSPGSKKIIAGLDSLKEFTVVEVTPERAVNLVKKGDKAAALILHKGLNDSLEAGKDANIEMVYDQAKDAETGILQGALIGHLINLTGTRSMERNAIERFDQQNPDLDSMMRKAIHQQISSNFTPQSSQKTQDSFLKTTPIVSSEETSPGLIQAVAGTAIMMLLFSLAAIGAGLIDEKQAGTLKRILFAPGNPINILIGKMLLANVISIIQLSVMFVFAWLAFGLDIFVNLPALLIMVLVTSFACSGFGSLLASIAKSRQQVQGLSTLIILIMSAIGGSMIPLFIMPIWMQKIAVFSVNYWSIQGFYDIFWRLLPVSDPNFLQRVGVLFAIGLVLNLIAVRFFKRNIVVQA
jgi:ABC-type multidrug transport system permease subunit